MRFQNGNYFVEDTMAENAFIHVIIAKSPLNINETQVHVVGKVEGLPPQDYLAICEGDVLKLLRKQNIRKQQTFMGM